jgi:hypothetical protein
MRVEFDRLLCEAQARYDAMTAEQKKEMREAQRKSWVIGETMLEHPEMSRVQAEELYEKVILGIGR